MEISLCYSQKCKFVVLWAAFGLNASHQTLIKVHKFSKSLQRGIERKKYLSRNYQWKNTGNAISPEISSMVTVPARESLYHGPFHHNYIILIWIKKPEIFVGLPVVPVLAWVVLTKVDLSTWLMFYLQSSSFKFGLVTNSVTPLWSWRY